MRHQLLATFSFAHQFDRCMPVFLQVTLASSAAIAWRRRKGNRNISGHIADEQHTNVALEK